MRWKFASLALILAVLGAIALAPISTEAAKPSAGLSGPVSGTTDTGGTFEGVVTVTRFVANPDGTLGAVGTLTGTLTDSTLAGGSAPIAGETATFLVTTAAGSCRILDLTLGPLDLDLLGLEVHLDTVHLEITAQQGPGNLLGNLLCAVANLLNGGGGLSGVLTQIVNLLNQIIGAL